MNLHPANVSRLRTIRNRLYWHINLFLVARGTFGESRHFCIGYHFSLPWAGFRLEFICATRCYYSPVSDLSHNLRLLHCATQSISIVCFFCVTCVISLQTHWLWNNIRLIITSRGSYKTFITRCYSASKLALKPARFIS